MAGSRTFTLLCGLLAATLVRATLSPPVVLSLGPEVIRERLTKELKDHNVTNILQQLPLLSAIRQKPAGGNSILGNLVNSFLNHIIWLRVTSANVLQLWVQPSANGQEIVVQVPLDMVAGLNTPLIKSLVEIHMETVAQAIIREETSKMGHPKLVLEDCSTKHGSVRISMLQKFSILVNSLANKIRNLLVPALPKLVKSQLCPIMKAAFEDMYADLLRLVMMPVSLSSDHMEFDLLSLAIKSNVIHLNLAAKLLDSEGNVTNWFNKSAVSLTMPTLNGAPLSFTVRQDVVNAVIVALLPPEEFMVLLDYVLPELAWRLKSKIKTISEKAANQMGRTQIVKILTWKSPELLLDHGSAKVTQVIVLEVFATSKVRRPFFTLGVEASSEAQFYIKDDQLMFTLNEISFDRSTLLNSSIGLFNPELLKDITTEILISLLIPNENGKLRSGIPISMIKALGFEAASWSVTRDALVITPASS
ncbi:BPI fold-containing family B member 1 [Pteropus alecto]|uniref:BPI fold-containing family B member 1 n=1 Tax=Pteropus alecto TaxID=9402 RepID=UPI0003F15F78|nr:BPI fold-containing family B member 1 [Pteropus alecto]